MCILNFKNGDYLCLKNIESISYDSINALLIINMEKTTYYYNINSISDYEVIL